MVKEKVGGDEVTALVDLGTNPKHNIICVDISRFHMVFTIRQKIKGKQG